MSPAIVERYERATGVCINNTYGPTEATSPTHLVPIGMRAPVDDDTGALAVGVPVSGAESKIVDPKDPSVEMPYGEQGEIATKGPMITRGYWNRPEATAEAIIDGWLRTGDVGKSDEQGWFWVVDRVKDMIKCLGLRGVAARSRGRALPTRQHRRGRRGRSARRLSRRKRPRLRDPAARHGADRGGRSSSTAAASSPPTSGLARWSSSPRFRRSPRGRSSVASSARRPGLRGTDGRQGSPRSRVCRRPPPRRPRSGRCGCLPPRR